MRAEGEALKPEWFRQWNESLTKSNFFQGLVENQSTYGVVQSMKAGFLGRVAVSF